jgi:Arc/MetJ-type ribon-helix-helix transcriptional regulator
MGRKPKVEADGVRIPVTVRLPPTVLEYIDSLTGTMSRSDVIIAFVRNSKGYIAATQRRVEEARKK